MEPTLPNFAASALVFPFALTVLAGLATALGSALAFFTKRTNMRRQAFIFSLLSGLAEPLGALVAMATLGWLKPAHTMGLVFAGVAGIMVYISLDELLPTARQYGRSHEVLAGIASGMAVIALSLLLLK